MTSGDMVVDKMADFETQGDFIPISWRKFVIRTEGRNKGKAYDLAINILSHIVYWYRPKKDSEGNLSKRFQADCPQLNYADLANRYNHSKDEIKSAMEHLEKMGLITRSFRTVTHPSGKKEANVMYVTLNYEKLAGITFSEKAKEVCAENEGIECETDTYASTDIEGMGVETDTYTNIYTNNITNMIDIKGRQGSPEILSFPLADLNEIKSNWNRYKITSSMVRETINYDNFRAEERNHNFSCNQSKERATEELKVLYEYDFAVLNYPEDKEYLNRVISIMTDIISKRETVTLKNKRYNSDYLGRLFYGLNSDEVSRVAQKFREALEIMDIGDKKKYVVRMLMNVRRDMEKEVEDFVRENYG